MENTKPVNQQRNSITFAIDLLICLQMLHVHDVYTLYYIVDFGSLTWVNVMRSVVFESATLYYFFSNLWYISIHMNYYILALKKKHSVSSSFCD